MKKKIGLWLLAGVLLLGASLPVSAASAEEIEEIGTLEHLEKITVQAGSTEEEKQEQEEELIEKLETGEALVLMGTAEEAQAVMAEARAGNTVSLTVGEKIYYMGWETSYFYINGNMGYCLEPSKGTPAGGDYAATVLQKNTLLSKALYYLYGGPGYTQEIKNAFFAAETDNDMIYCYCHIILSYIYDGESTAGDAFIGVNDSVKQGCINITNAIKNMPEPPAADLKINPSNQEAYYNEEEDYQQTDIFTLSGDSRNSVTWTVPSNVTLHNQSTGKSATGKVKVSGGEKFYFTAPTSVTGTWNTGTVYGTVSNDYKAIIFNQGSSTQTIGSWSYTIGESVAPVSLSVKWLDYGKIALQKVSGDTEATADGIDDDFYTLKGAVYEVMDKSGNVVDTLTTDETGQAKSKALPYGKYTVKEKASSQGYLVEVSSHTFVLKEASHVITSTETPQYGKVELLKQDSETEKAKPQGAASLQGAVYELYNSEGTTVDTLTTDESGHVISRNHPLGNYTLKEITPSTGYNLDPKVYDVQIASADRTTKVYTKNVVSGEDIIRGDVQLVKFREDQDSEEEYKTPLEGVQFTFTSQSTGEVVKTITTDKNGYATTVDEKHSRGGLVYDTYLVEEVKGTAPAGVKLVEPFEVTIAEEGITHYYIIEDKNIVSPITVVKKDATTGKVIPVANTEFRLLDANKEAVTMTTHYPKEQVHETFKTDESGSFTFPEKIAYGVYYLEEVQAPEGYLKGELLEFSVEEGHKWTEPITVTYEDTPAMGRITVHKTDSETENNLEGVIFTVTAKTDIVTADGTIRQKKGEVADTITTDQNGLASTKELFLGKYLVEETTNLQGYVKLSEAKEVELKYKDQVTPLVEEVLEVVNHPTKIILTKVKKGTKEPLEGVTFAFWNQAFEVETDDPSMIEKQELVTDENGQIVLQYLSSGTYCYQETATLEGYILEDTIHEITIDDNGYVDGQTVGEVAMENDFTKVDISKQEMAGEQEIQGATIEIFDTEKNHIETWVSGKEPHRIEGLAPGEYVLKETITPNGYLVASDIRFVVEESGEVQTVVMKDAVPMGKIKIHKTDKETNKALQGVEFELMDGDGKVLETLVTDESGKAESKEYPIGTYKEGVFGESSVYYLVETKALKGYVLDETVHEIVFEYADESTAIIEKSFELTNEKQPVETPADSETPKTSTTNSESKTSGATTASPVKTGDTTKVAGFMIACIVAAGAAVLILKWKRKR